MPLKAENVFKPGAYPEYTYVSRNYENTGISYELRLKQALRTAGCLTSLIGPSKTGKIILCEKVIGFDNVVEISGADFSDNTDFWATVAAKVGLPYMGEITAERALKEEKGNSGLDLYGLIVESLAKNPPAMELYADMIYDRILKEHLNKLQGILEEKEELYRAVEWKDGKVYILDPLFLFYLRWGRISSWNVKGRDRC